MYTRLCRPRFNTTFWMRCKLPRPIVIFLFEVFCCDIKTTLVKQATEKLIYGCVPRSGIMTWLEKKLKNNNGMVL